MKIIQIIFRYIKQYSIFRCITVPILNYAYYIYIEIKFYKYKFRFIRH